MASPSLPIGSGLAVSVPVGPAVQVPLTKQGGTIINLGATPVSLTPVIPVQGLPYILAPNGSVPWPGIGSLYAFVTGTTPGALYYVNGVTAISAGNAGVGSVGLSGTTGVIGTPGIFIASGASSDIVIGLGAAVTVWSYGFGSTSSDPTRGNVTVEFVTANVTPGALGVTDRLKATSEFQSSRLSGLYVPSAPPALGYNVVISNFTDVEIEFTFNYSPIVTV